MGFVIVWTEPISRILSWAIIYLGLQLLASSSGTPRRSGARPCMRVRICSLHPRLTVGLFPQGNSRPFGVDVTVVTSILADGGRYPLPIFPAITRGACSDFPLLSVTRRAIAQLGLRALYHKIRVWMSVWTSATTGYTERYYH